MPGKDTHRSIKLSFAGMLVTVGIIFGDIGTSPLYVLKAIFAATPVTTPVVLGALSAIFWTLTLQTSVKYVGIILRADNNGEGGIFALYTLLRRLNKKWLMVPAMIGGAMLFADGMITPAISVSSAVEGLQMLPLLHNLNTVPIVIAIISALFLMQQFGTRHIGKLFGPVMMLWFTMIGFFGAYSLVQSLWVLKAINPMWAAKLLIAHPGGFWLLGAVFLCTTGAEALYSDLGHCGRSNIRVTWGVVKISLLLSYFGQGAWLIRNPGQIADHINPFYSVMPHWFLLPGIGIATLAAIIASQALISGSFTLINEATRLGIWFKSRVVYPTEMRGQLYIPSVNKMLWIGCIFMVLFFQSSHHMEAAYGLAIVVTMLMTTILMFYFLRLQGRSLLQSWLFMSGFLVIEGAFLVANAAKFIHGGWVPLVFGALLVAMMVSLFKARKIIRSHLSFVPVSKYTSLITSLSNDLSVPKYSTHLVYLTRSSETPEIEAKIVHSILYKQPKRADLYWFVHLTVSDDPYRTDYRVTHLVKDDLIRIDFYLGFRVLPRINLLFRKVVEDLVATKEVDITSRYASLSRSGVIGDFRFVLIDNFLSYDLEIPFIQRSILRFYFLIKRLTLSDAEAFGLDTSSVVVEKFPLVNTTTQGLVLNRLQ